MKKLLILVVLTLSTLQTNATNWMTSLEDAQKLAVATNKLILVDFWATWCGPCRRMDADSWSKVEVQELMKNYIPVKIDIDANKNLARKYGVRGIPYVFILDANGEVIYDKLSFMKKDQVMKVLKKYSLNTKSLQQDLASFYNDKTAENALNVAKRYYDFTMLVDEKIKSDFLSVANKYMDKSEDLFDEEGKKDEQEQLIDLYQEVYAKILRGKYEKGLKSLTKKFKEDEIEEQNKSFYDFLNFISYKKTGDNENAKLWFNKLKTHKDFKSYILKSRKI